MAEAKTLEATLPVHGRGLVGTPWWGMICLFATEGVLFAYLIFSYAYLGSQGFQPWPPSGKPPSLLLAVPATILLIGSSLVLEWSRKRARERRTQPALIALAIAIVMGAGFVLLSLREWSDKSFKLATDSYSSIYFVMTGIHLTHVALGLFALIVVFLWSLTGRMHAGHEQHRTLVTIYWHFVDIVWLFIFATVYISPRIT